MEHNKRGKLIVIDGLDGSGKGTQAEILYNKLKHEGKKVKLITYPDYENKSSVLVKMYLDGEFSDDLNDVNAYAASSFYAVDRYASYTLFWKKYLDEGYIIIANRYVSSNAIHQMVKLPQVEWDEYLIWADDYEYNKLGLPRPNKVILLDMSREIANRLILERYKGDVEKKDIHENNLEYLDKCQITAHYCAKKLGWTVIKCYDGDLVYTLDRIANEILDRIVEEL